jgi:hypothetical protein
MNKIPTVFKRDPEDMRHLLPEVNPNCQWVLDGEGIGTRKYDGTCVMFDGERWWARREVKDGGRWPQEFQTITRDPVTGKTVGWQPIAFSSFAKWHALALLDWTMVRGEPEPGTFELCGPKINGNPEGFGSHVLIPHRYAEVVLDAGGPYTFDTLREMITLYCSLGREGIVWHHPDGRMAKLKGRDFTR